MFGTLDLEGGKGKGAWKSVPTSPVAVELKARAWSHKVSYLQCIESGGEVIDGGIM